MKTSISGKYALGASTLALFATRTLAQSVATTLTVAVGPVSTLACYEHAEPLSQDNTNTFQTSGLCQIRCANQNYPVMAITGGSTCYCGDELPPLDTQTDESKCDTPCQGFGAENCGGIGYWQVYLTGTTGDVETAPNSTSSSTSAASSSTHPAETVVVTQPPSSQQTTQSSSGGGPNKVGIAVGVVVGVVVLAALAGGAFLYLKQKRRREIEEEHKAQAAVNSFVGSRNSDQKSDTRLDPSMASTYRRESIGSIADERDFSRRILQVRNPDRGSMNSAA